MRIGFFQIILIIILILLFLTDFSKLIKNVKQSFYILRNFINKVQNSDSDSDKQLPQK